MTIAQKLLISFGGLSALIMVGLTSEVTSSLTSRTEMQAVSVVVDSGAYVAQVVHELQIERGMSAGFLSSKGEKNRDALMKQRTNVDAAMKRLQALPATDLPKSQLEAYKALTGIEENLNAKRTDITNLTIAVPDAIGFYTGVIKHGIEFMNNTVTVADVARASQALRVLIQAKEFAGQERAAGNAAFTATKFQNAALMQRFIQLGAQRKVLLDEFVKLAPPAQVEQLMQLRSSDLFAQLRAMEDGAVVKAFANEPLETPANEWFAASTNRINKFKEIEDDLGRVISLMAHSEVKSAGNMLWLMVLLSLTVLVGVLWIYFRVVNKGIRDPLNMMVERIRGIANTSQFGQRVAYDAHDEVGDAARAINQLLNNLEQSISEANKVVGAIANADFSQRMQGSYVGDLNTLKQGVNGSADSVAFMMQELEKVMQGLASGRFDVQMDAKVPQAFRDTVAVSFKKIHSVVADILNIMARMSAGDFAARVNADAHGDILTLKNSINNSMSDLAEVVKLMSDVVGAQALGDLTHELSSGVFKGHLHDLKNAINYSAAKVKEVVDLAIDASMVVSDASSQVSQGAADLSARVQEQAAALEQTSATMHQMTSQVQANTTNARKVADLARNVQTQSVDGANVMQQTITAMQTISESSHKMAEIVSLIDGIAFQTNLLALNAAVEAARAGEHGRGFAVVASEVRALAGKSAAAAKDIKGLIDESVRRVDAGTALAQKSGDMLGDITHAVQEVAGMIEEIAHASHEQSEGIGQVHLAIAQIDAVTQQNAALVEETTAAAESLNSEATSLGKNMSFFNTGTIRHKTSAAAMAKPASRVVKTVVSQKSALSAPAKANSEEWGEF